MSKRFFIELTGRRFGRLTVTSFAYLNIRRQAMWNCECSCGKTKIVLGTRLRLGRTRSCGCLAREDVRMRSRTHGMSNSDEYRIYKGMINRYYLDTTQAYERYGRRGIEVCARWRWGDGQQSGFDLFLNDMGMRPSKRHSLERRDNSGDYDPSNVKWATALEQANNSRRIRVLNIAGYEMSMADAHARFSAVSYSAVQRRLNAGWQHEAAIFLPARAQPPIERGMPF